VTKGKGEWNEATGETPRPKRITRELQDYRRSLRNRRMYVGPPCGQEKRNRRELPKNGAKLPSIKKSVTQRRATGNILRLVRNELKERER